LVALLPAARRLALTLALTLIGHQPLPCRWRYRPPELAQGDRHSAEHPGDPKAHHLPPPFAAALADIGQDDGAGHARLTSASVSGARRFD